MKIINILSKAFLIISISFLVSCHQKEIKQGLIIPPDTKQIIIRDKDGKSQVLDANGNPIPSCRQRKGTDNECKIPEGLFENLCKQIDTDQPQKYKNTSNENYNIRKVTEIRHLTCSFSSRINPFCITDIDRITGERTEWCIP